MRTASFKRFSFRFLGLALMVTSLAVAQTATTGVVSVTVTDATGAVVPGAKVELANTDTNATATQPTNAAGQSVFPSIAAGRYKLTVKKEGFRTTTVPDLTVEVNKSLNVTVPLEIGAQSQTVEVTATAAVALQTTDAQIGNTVSTNAILRLPSIGRNATELMNLQPATAAVGGAIMMRTAGAIDDQNTVTVDGIDITQNIVAAGVSVPTPVDSIEEFRGGVTNPNANFSRSSGGNITLIGRHGSNAIRGALYEYLQNWNLNSNTWDNNLIGVPKAVIHDNRFGARLGGPIRKNKTFLFGNWEERRFQSAGQVTRTVPTQSLRNGILQFKDLAGNTQQFNLKTAAVCGLSGDQPCDPRGLGVSPAVAAQWAKEPLPNVPGGDGLNTGSFFGVASTPIRNDYGVARLDHSFTDRLQFNASYTYYRQIQTSSAQVSIVGGNLQSVRQTPNRGSVTSASLNYQVKPNLLNSFRFGYVHDTDDTGALPPSGAAGILGIPGSQTSAGPIALLIGGGVSSFLDSPIDMDTQRARHQADYAGFWQYLDDVTWVHGKHTATFGVQFNKIPYTHVRADKVVGSLSSLAALVDGDSQFLFVKAANQPLTCGGSTTNCVRTTDLKNWDRFYASALGLVNNVNILTARDASLKPLPFGTDLRNQTNQYATYMYGQDSWRIKPSLTLTFGLAYGWQTAPTEVNNLQTLQINAANNTFISGPEYIAAKQAAALQGQTYNPLLGYLPVGSANHSVVNVDWGDVAPRVALAWNPSATSGFLGKVLGERKTVVRGGFAIVYDRTNTVQTVLIPMLGVGFAQTITVQGPLCNATGAGGAGCNAAGGTANVGLSAFRVGVDGTLPLPTVPSVSIPVVPPVGQYSETLSFQDDPNSKVGRSYNIDLSIQRDLPGNIILEVGFIGRQGRRLPQAVSLGNAPYMLVDTKSGQSFAQAFDATAQFLRTTTDPKAIPPAQPWFENQFPGLNPGGTATSAIASAAKALITTGDVANLFLTLDGFRRSLKLPTYNNDQVLDLFMRTYVAQSNYNAGFLTVNKRFSRGLTLSGNYTYSKALDDNVLNQNQAFFFSNSYHPGVDYGPTRYDQRHAFNAIYTYDIPAGRGHRLSGGRILNQILGGWYTSGIVTARTGTPQVVTQGTNSFGADAAGFAQSTIAIPTASLSGSSTSTYNASCKAEGANAANKGGSGTNVFADPCAAYNSFRYVNIGSDTRTGKANPFYGLPFWNFDMSFGKSTKIGERFDVRFSADMFNVFNHHTYNDPSYSLQNPNGFGVITSTLTPANRVNSARWIQFGLRLEF